MCTYVRVVVCVSRGREEEERVVSLSVVISMMMVMMMCSHVLIKDPRG